MAVEEVLLDLEAEAVKRHEKWHHLSTYASTKHALDADTSNVSTPAATSDDENGGSSGGPNTKQKILRGKGRCLVASRHLTCGEEVLLFSSVPHSPLSNEGVAVVRHSYWQSVCSGCFAALKPDFKKKEARKPPTNHVMHHTQFCSPACQQRYVSRHPYHDYNSETSTFCGAIDTLVEACPQLPFALDLDSAILAMHILAARLETSSSFVPTAPSSAAAAAAAATDSHNGLHLPLALESHRARVGADAWRAAKAGGAVLLRLLHLHEGQNDDEEDARETMVGELLLQIRFNAFSIDSLLPSSAPAKGEANAVAYDGHGPSRMGSRIVPGAILALFPAPAAMNHSCRPNVNLCWYWGTAPQSSPSASCSSTTTGPRLIVKGRTVRSVKAGEELTFSYLTPSQLLASRPERQRLLLEAFLFRCACVRCGKAGRRGLQPGGESSAAAAERCASQRAVVGAAMQTLAANPRASLPDSKFDELLSVASWKQSNTMAAVAASSLYPSQGEIEDEDGSSLAVRADASTCALLAAQRNFKAEMSKAGSATSTAKACREPGMAGAGRAAGERGGKGGRGRGRGGGGAARAVAAAADAAAQCWVQAELPLTPTRADMLWAAARALHSVAAGEATAPLGSAASRSSGKGALVDERAAEALSIYAAAYGPEHERTRQLGNAIRKEFFT